MRTVIKNCNKKLRNSYTFSFDAKEYIVNKAEL